MSVTKVTVRTPWRVNPGAAGALGVARWCRDHLPQSRVLGWGLCQHFYHRPVFVVGVGRSGTSALCNALNAHAQLLIGGEAPLFHHLGAIADAYRGEPEYTYYEDRSAIATADLFDRLRRLAFETEWGAGYGTRGLLTRRLYHGKRLRPVRFWGAKAFPLDERAARGLRQLYPEAKFLYIHRNGIENVQSRTRYQGFRARSFREHCETWARATLELHYLTSWDAALTVAHADLLCRREETFRRILAFLGVDQHPGPAAYAASTLQHPVDQPTARDVDVTSVLAGRKPAHESWSEEQKRTFEDVCGEAMRRLGYEMSL